jgi:hypothetical protein
MSLIDSKQPVISLGNSLASLEANEKLYCETLNQRLAPHFSMAHLTHEYGEISLAPARGYSKESSLDLRGKFVKLSIDSQDIFHGIVGSQSDAPEGTYKNISGDVPTGDNHYSIYSLDFLLDRIYVDLSYLENSKSVNSIFSFNGDKSKMEENRSTEKDGDSYYFDFSSDAELWSVYNILEYLLARFSSQSGLTWESSGAAEWLNNVYMQLSPEGKTVRQCLNELITPSRGYSYFVKYEDGKCKIHVVSVSDVNIDINGSTVVPANDDTLSINENIEYSRTIKNVRISRVEESAYSYIKVRSEPVRMMATFKLGSDSGGLKKDWSEDDESSYSSAVDYERRDEKYDKVFAAFKFSEDWNKQDYTPTGCIPLVNEDDLEITFSDENPTAFLAHVFERTLPLLKDTDKPKSGYKKPFLLLKDEDGNYHISDKTDFEGENSAPSVGFSLSDEAPGIQLKPPYNHILGKGHFSGDSDYAPLYNFEDALLTVSFYTDSPLVYKLQGASGGAGRIKTVFIPGYHYWAAMPETYVDRTQKTSSGDVTVYRDDREKLKKIAALLKVWYGRERNTLSFSYDKIFPFPYLGAMISNIYSGGSFIPSGTIISGVDFDFMSQTLSVSSDFGNIDFSKLSRRSVHLSRKSTAKRINRLEEKISNIPLREGRGGAGAETEGKKTAIPAIITGTDGVNYSIDLYANGYDEDSTGTGTMQILDLNLSETLSTGAKILAFESITSVVLAE